MTPLIFGVGKSSGGANRYQGHEGYTGVPP
jgi:hypothetical protein